MMPLRHFTPVEVHTGRRRLELAIFLTVFISAGMFALAEGRAVFFLIACVPIAMHVWAAAQAGDPRTPDRPQRRGAGRQRSAAPAVPHQQ